MACQVSVILAVIMMLERPILIHSANDAHDTMTCGSIKSGYISDWLIPHNEKEAEIGGNGSERRSFIGLIT